MSAASALQKAIFLRLSADATLAALLGAKGIVDSRPNGPVEPLLVLAAIDSRDHSTATEEGEDHRVTLEIWSGAAGQRQAQAIAAAARVALHDAPLPLAGHHLVFLLHRETRIRRDARSRFHRADMHFHAVTEPLAS